MTPLDPRRDRPTVAGGCVVRADFRPHPLLRGAHVQTLFPALLRVVPRLALRVERLELPDGDFVDLGWWGQGGGPIAVLLHGMTGGFESKYLRGLARRLAACGWRGVVLQLRGSGPEPNRLPRSYHHGDTGDFLYLCRLLRQREPAVPVYAAGWSMGANILLKALGEEGERAPLTAAAAACAPFRLAPCAEKLRHGFSRVYTRALLRELRVQIRRKHGPVPTPSRVDLAAALRARDFFAFDDAYTAPLNGFADARDYYARCECGPFLAAIRRPTLIVNSLDDPFMVPQIVPSQADLAPCVRLELAAAGGHVGFIARGRLGLPHYWLEERLARYFLELESARAARNIASP
jgi:predicted alpha/beta-fold hydrolase